MAHSKKKKWWKNLSSGWCWGWVCLELCLCCPGWILSLIPYRSWENIRTSCHDLYLYFSNICDCYTQEKCSYKLSLKTFKNARFWMSDEWMDETMPPDDLGTRSAMTDEPLRPQMWSCHAVIYASLLLQSNKVTVATDKLVVRCWHYSASPGWSISSP